MNAKNQKTRRSFITTSALAASAFTVVPRHVLGGADAPNRKLNIAGIGVGGMGGANLKRCASENIVALCDVDTAYADKTFKAFPAAKVYGDYRVMLEKQKDIDAVVVATPDHSHAIIALAAIRADKHVYVQKPLTHSIEEARLLTEAARAQKVATQMGNQGHSGDDTRLICEWIQSGAIGLVREIHAWTNRPVWPQSVEVDRPADTPPVPATLNWDMWIGPAPSRPYHPVYVPGTWRAWWDFGTGSLGDLGCHILDAPFWALNLKYPLSVEGCISTYWEGLWKKTEPRNENFPRSTIVRYKFPARGDLPPLTLTWWDGGMMPPRPEGVGPNEPLGDSDGGVILLGDKGVMICGCYGLRPRVFPAEKMRDLPTKPQRLTPIPGGIEGHEKDWIQACKGGAPAGSNFEHSGPLTEMVLLGNLAVRYPNRQLLWDAGSLQVTNDKDANAYVRRKYRDGWAL